MPESPYVFISYASADRDRVLPIVDRLEQAGVKTWIDREGIHGGANYGLEISDAIEHAVVMLVMCSDASFRSRNVKQEIALGWKYDRPYLPLLLEPVAIPKDVEYWLEAAQWVEVLDHPEDVWMATVGESLERHGITVQSSTVAPAAARKRPLLVGREKEQAQLRKHLDQMLAGHGGTVLVGGEAGIGKTTLVEDLSIEAEEQGCLVLWGHAYDFSVTPPYGPWLEIFREYRALAATELPPLPPFVFDVEELAKVGSQQRLFIELDGFFSSVASEQPLLLVLDDLHWFDQAALEFVRFFTRQLTNVRVLMIATYRSDELHRRHPLYALLPILVREGRAERIDVKPLSDVGQHALVENRYDLDETDLARLDRYLDDHAEGNPLYAGELLRSLEEEGVLNSDGTTWRLGAIEQVRVPPLLQQVIEGRLSRLSDDTRGLLQVAAVIGQGVPVEMWQQVSGASDAELVTAIERGNVAQLIEEVAGGTVCRFRHALLREVLYNEVIGIRRRSWHQKTAEALEKIVDPDPDLVAHHYQQSGDARAVTWLVKAGERAQRAYVWMTAADRYDAALARLSEQGASPIERASMLWRIAYVVRYTDRRRSVELLQEAYQLAVEANEPGFASICRMQFGGLQMLGDDVRAGLNAFEKGVKSLRALSGSEREHALSLRGLADDEYPEGTLAVGLALSGRLNDAVSHGMQMIDEIPEPELSPGRGGSPYADGLLGLAEALAYLGLPLQAKHRFEQAVDRYRAARHFVLEALALQWQLELVNLTYFPENLESRRQLVMESEAAGQLAQPADFGTPARGYALPLLMLEGEWSEARRTIANVDDLAQSRARFDVERWQAWLSHRQGDRAGVGQLITKVVPEGPAQEPGTSLFWPTTAMQRLAATMAIDEVDLPAARSWLEAHDRWLDWSSAVLGRAEGALLWAQYHHACGDQIVAREYADKSLAHASEPRQPLALITAHRFLGLLDTEEQRFAEADKHLQESLRVADACAAPFERALTLLEMARLRVAQGNTDEARELLAEVRAVCEPLEAKPTLQKVAELETRLKS